MLSLTHVTLRSLCGLAFAQAGPANAMFFLFYDALNSAGTSALSAAAGGGSGGDSLVGILPMALHLSASSLATIPANLVRTPAEVVKQRLQVRKRDEVWRQKGEGIGYFLFCHEGEATIDCGY